MSIILQDLAKYKTCLGSCAIEGNPFAQKHLKAIEGMSILEQYFYLKNVFDELLREESYDENISE